MMHNQPNNPEYCQGIYEAAKKVVEYTCDDYDIGTLSYLRGLHKLIDQLERALEGKP